MQFPISAAILEGLCREASTAAGRLVRQYRLPVHEREDLSQDLLLNLITRLKKYNPCRGTLGAFAAVIIQHRVARLAVLLRQDRARFAMTSLDDPISGRDGVTPLDTFAEDDGYLAWMGSSTNPITALEARLSINRALNTLSPEQIGLCAELAIGSIGRAGAESGPSRATLYRRLHDVRLQLLAAGIGPGT